MAGGTFTAQNKVRPGAYINFKSVSAPTITVGKRGVVAFAVGMDWGAEGKLIELLSSDLLDGSSIPKIGYSAGDAESLVFRCALKKAYKALVYRADTGGSKATLTLGGITATAKYNGVLGNSLYLEVLTSGTKFEVNTYLGTVLKDSQTVSAIADLEDNDFIVFSGTSDISAAVKTVLTGGTNGTLSSAFLSAETTGFFALLQQATWNTLAVGENIDGINPLILAFIKQERDSVGKKVQAVCVDYNTADYEGIISVSQGYKTADETISKYLFAVEAAGLTAGANVNESNTYAIISNAEEITDALSDEDIKTALNAGKFILSRRSDGVIVVEQDINTFQSVTPVKGKVFKKNRVIRCLDEIANTTKSAYETSYIGKIDNDSDGRDLLKADLVSFGKQLQNYHALQNFDGLDDITLAQGTDGDAVLATWAAQPVDSMEKLYLTVLLS